MRCGVSGTSLEASVAAIELTRCRVACLPCRKVWALTMPADAELPACPLCGGVLERAAGMDALCDERSLSMNRAEG